MQQRKSDAVQRLNERDGGQIQRQGRNQPSPRAQDCGNPDRATRAETVKQPRSNQEEHDNLRGHSQRTRARSLSGPRCPHWSNE